MVHFVEGGTVLRASDRDVSMFRENPEVTVIGRIFATFMGVGFLTGALFFWYMPVADDGLGVLIIRSILCGGLALIGCIIGWSALYPRKSVGQLEMDPAQQELRVGKVTADKPFTIKHRVPFADIEQFYAGSQSSGGHAHGGGSTCLYVKADGGPRNGVLIVGAVYELEELARELNGMLKAPAPENQAQSPEIQRGFGRRGL